MKKIHVLVLQYMHIIKLFYKVKNYWFDNKRNLFLDLVKQANIRVNEAVDVVCSNMYRLDGP